jgi:hypothetical protein
VAYGSTYGGTYGAGADGAPVVTIAANDPIDDTVLVYGSRYPGSPVVSVACVTATPGAASYPDAGSWQATISALSVGENTITASVDGGAPDSVVVEYVEPPTTTTTTSTTTSTTTTSTTSTTSTTTSTTSTTTTAEPAVQVVYVDGVGHALDAAGALGVGVSQGAVRVALSTDAAPVNVGTSLGSRGLVQ